MPAKLPNHFEFWCDEGTEPEHTIEDLGDGLMRVTITVVTKLGKITTLGPGGGPTPEALRALGDGFTST